MGYVLSNWKRCTNPTALRIYHETLDEAISLGYLDRYEFRPNLYLYSGTQIKRLGEFRFEYERKKGITRDSVCGRMAIGIHKYLLDNETILRGTIQHEVAHYLALISDYRDHLHDPVWFGIALKLGEKYGHTPSRYADTHEAELMRHKRAEIKTTWKYEVQCPKCGHIWQHKKMCRIIKTPERYLCVTCNCTLVRIK